jgi:hypothetical protein
MQNISSFGCRRTGLSITRWGLFRVFADILTNNPEVWKKTIFILTYHENDGYFDYAPSFVAADPKRPETGGASAGIDTAIEYTYVEDELKQGVSEKEARSGPIGMGFRVPMIIASPWSRGGFVNSQLFDHTSTLMFLEQFVQHKYGKTVKEENIRHGISAAVGSASTLRAGGRLALDCAPSRWQQAAAAPPAALAHRCCAVQQRSEPSAKRKDARRQEREARS